MRNAPGLNNLCFFRFFKKDKLIDLFGSVIVANLAQSAMKQSVVNH